MRKLALSLSLTFLLPVFLVAGKNPADYPLRIQILLVHERHFTNGSNDGYGRGNITDSDSVHGFDFTYSSMEELRVTELDTRYIAKWKKEPVRLELLVEEIGAPGKYHTFDLNTTARDEVYMRERDGIVSITQQQYKAYKAPKPSGQAGPNPGSVSPDSGGTLAHAKELLNAKRFSEALALFRESASGGNAEAQRYVGDAYKNGWGGVTQDYAQARTWYEKSAANGNAAAANDLGVLYYLGGGAAQDYAQARSLFEKAAAAGNSGAMNNLGTLYQGGKGVVQDYAQARQWYEKSATAGNAAAMGQLGHLYEHGLGVAQDYTQARQWYERAAAGGDATGKNNLGYMYQRGQGVAQDYTQARQWYEKAAAAGNAAAKTNLEKLPK
jgi:TPR repeat protein